MKRTKNINQEAFRKSWRSYRLAPIALSLSAVFILAGCEKTDETVSMYQNASDCSQANPSMSEQCSASYNKALQEAARTAPKYATQADCVAEFGESQCTPAPAPAQAGMVPGTTGSASNTAETSKTAESHGGSAWMPLMAGYMMGRMMGGSGFAQQPLFTSNQPTSPANGKFVDASGKNYGAATSGRSVTVPGSTLAPKPAVTTTTTRGGFGESVAKQASMQHSNTSSSSKSSARSMGS
ncbi:DUF1190 family protein [Candidatus Fukatsuia symbiotica]|uniref:UPF0441 protein CCS41_09700 n=1 Tax=Candidatus Fukatsuia symbiotica TaxID=1878942 RepID=A0A2U8I6A8_9GAMM|nr:DUF1190 family protein [Candidatus Fukatsuia symbiotica]AWK14690.1 hypothetical protein CCS41_09700 [Candidatus Fukatsuia symbiotica]MEA9445014.1 DUF1190 family protein [Candidatus Fukatsuia symbiotica]